MTSTKHRIATVAPPTLQKQLDVLAAARTLLGQEDEAARWRRAEIAALRREYGELVLMVQELLAPIRPAPALTCHQGRFRSAGGFEGKRGRSPNIQAGLPGRRKAEAANFGPRTVTRGRRQP